MGNINIVAALTGLFAWGVILFLSYRVYKNQVLKPKLWKMIIVLLVGLFSFSFNFNMFETMIRIPILPLGVWILYLFNGKKEGWKLYRPYAWIGFLVNFIFLAASFIAIPINHAIYPENDPTTYISNIENASLIKTHPSAKNYSFNKAKFLKQVNTLKEEQVLSQQWYQDTDSKMKIERFPYQLVGASPKFGSGLITIIYIENDGKGLLISTAKKQYYFHSDHLLIGGGK